MRFERVDLHLIRVDYTREKNTAAQLAVHSIPTWKCCDCDAEVLTIGRSTQGSEDYIANIGSILVRGIGCNQPVCIGIRAMVMKVGTRLGAG